MHLRKLIFMISFVSFSVNVFDAHPTRNEGNLSPQFSLRRIMSFSLPSPSLSKSRSKEKLAHLMHVTHDIEMMQNFLQSAPCMSDELVESLSALSARADESIHLKKQVKDMIDVFDEEKKQRIYQRAAIYTKVIKHERNVEGGVKRKLISRDDADKMILVSKALYNIK